MQPLTLLSLLLSFCGSEVHACTYFEMQAPGGVWVAGRSMELAGPDRGLPWQVTMHPRGTDTRWRGSPHNKYGYIGVDLFPSVSSAFVSDGINEVGLSVSSHTMRTSEYQKPDPKKRSLNLIDVVNFLLGHFSNVSDVTSGLGNVSVTSGGMSRDSFSHWAVADAHGRSVVVEYIGSELVVHPNDVRVMTNDPEYTWHVKNLNMYVDLQPDLPAVSPSVVVNTTDQGLVPTIWSQGFNLHSLPGDLSPASRFVRMFYLRQFAELHNPIASVDDAVVLATALLNDVFIPRGSVAPIGQARGPNDYDFTQYGLVKIPALRRLLFRSYRSMTWHQVDLDKLDWSLTRTIPLSDGSLGIVDVTSKFQLDPLVV